MPTNFDRPKTPAYWVARDCPQGLRRIAPERPVEKETEGLLRGSPEIRHLLGLAHSDDPAQLMHAQSPLGSYYGSGDLAGLHQLGAAAGGVQMRPRQAGLPLNPSKA